MPATPVAEWAAGGNAPILVIEGADDRLAPHAGESLRARFPERVRLEVVDAAGHALLPERAQRVAELVLAYLGEAR